MPRFTHGKKNQPGPYADGDIWLKDISDDDVIGSDEFVYCADAGEFLRRGDLPEGHRFAFAPPVPPDPYAVARKDQAQRIEALVRLARANANGE